MDVTSPMENFTMSLNMTDTSAFPSLNCSLFPHPTTAKDSVTIAIALINGLICSIGLLGNGLVIYVIIRYTKMKTVTNMYILNLSIADGMFLVGLPLIISTSIIRYWIFGFALCKLYYICSMINMFTGTFTLAVMAGDRYLAVCFPISSMKFRTNKYASLAITATWVLSFFFMLPIVLYATVKEHPCHDGVYTCLISWPDVVSTIGQQLFLIYTMLLGFIIPMALICIFYTLLVIRLRTSGPHGRSAEKKRSHRKVTKLVTIVIIVYIVCWLPYWIFQIDLLATGKTTLAPWQIMIFQIFSVMSYANSMVNPILYAFTNSNFREAFIGAFTCVGNPLFGGGSTTNSSRRKNEYKTVEATECKETKATADKNINTETQNTSLNHSSVKDASEQVNGIQETLFEDNN